MTIEARITPSPERGRGNGPETRPRAEPSERGDVAPNLPALAGTLTPSGRGGGQIYTDSCFSYMDLYKYVYIAIPLQGYSYPLF